MPIQIGRKKQVPIYGTIQDLSLNTLSNYFTVTDGGSYYWTKGEINYTETAKAISLIPGNIGSKSGTATITLEAVRDLNDFSMWGRYYTPSDGEINLTVAGETILNAVSGSYGPSDPTTENRLYNIVSNRTLSKGDKIVLKYYKSSSTSTTYETYTEFTIAETLNYTDINNEIIKYESKILPQTIKNIYFSPTKKVIGGWIKTSSIAKQFYSSLGLNYTGDYTMSTVTIDGTNYNLYALTSSGTLTLPKAAQVWACGGGSGGDRSISGSSFGQAGRGGCGGYVLETITLSKGEYTVTIGAGGNSNTNGGSTTIGNYSVAGGSSSKGGSGGGGACKRTSSGAISIFIGKSGARISTYPFGVTSLKAHCAGGGGGNAWKGRTGDGGSNGSDGLPTSSNSITSTVGAGGEYGGGKGGKGGSSSSSPATAGSNATFYGGGGGGGGLQGTTSFTTKAGGKGYQGVVYVAIPK